MEDFICSVCYMIFDKQSVIPRVLKCGHTICSDCLEKVMQTSCVCPQCRSVITKEVTNQFPINYSLLSVQEFLSSTQTSQRHLQELTTSLQTALVSVSEGFNKMSGALGSLQDFYDLTTGDLDAAQQLISGVYLNLRSFSMTGTMQRSECVRDSMTLKVTAKRSAKTILNYIYNKVSSGSKLFAVTLIGGLEKFAAFSFWGNKLALHAFGPKPEESNLETVWFQDLQELNRGRNKTAFLDITYDDSGIRYKIILDIFSESKLSDQFVRYCTGESGPLLKGSPYVEGKDLENSYEGISFLLGIKQFNFDGQLVSGKYECDSSVVNCFSRGAQKGDVVMQHFDEFYKLSKLEEEPLSIYSVIGKVENPSNFPVIDFNEESPQIKDCGIVFNL